MQPLVAHVVGLVSEDMLRHVYTTSEDPGSKSADLS